VSFVGKRGERERETERERERFVLCRLHACDRAVGRLLALLYAASPPKQGTRTSQACRVVPPRPTCARTTRAPHALSLLPRSRTKTTAAYYIQKKTSSGTRDASSCQKPSTG
jgi:hypothetical protein